MAGVRSKLYLCVYVASTIASAEKWLVQSGGYGLTPHGVECATPLTWSECQAAVAALSNLVDPVMRSPVRESEPGRPDGCSYCDSCLGRTFFNEGSGDKSWFSTLCKTGTYVTMTSSRTTSTSATSSDTTSTSPTTSPTSSTKLSTVTTRPICSCTNGTPATGASCVVGGDEVCASCEVGFHVSGEKSVNQISVHVPMALLQVAYRADLSGQRYATGV